MEVLVATSADIDYITRVEIESKLQSVPNLLELHDIDFETRAYRWKTWFAGQSPASAKPERALFKVVDNEKLIGYLAIHLTTRHDTDAEIQSFYIIKPYQRKGIGTQLLKHAANWMISFNAKSLCVGIASENPYQAFYLKHSGSFLNPHWIVWGDVNLLREKL